MAYEEMPLREVPKEEKNQEQKITTIYAEYLRYLVSVKDKNAALKFSEFSSISYSPEIVNLSTEYEGVKGRHI